MHKFIEPESYIIDTPELFERLQKYFAKNKDEFLFFDTETDGLITSKSRLFGISVCANETKSFYIVWRDDKGSIIWNDILQNRIINWFHDLAKTRKLVAHNACFDILIIETNWKIDLTDYLYADTQVLKHSVEEEKPFGLKEVSEKLFGPQAIKPQDDLKQNVLSKGGRWVKDQKDMYLADTAILGKYCNFDTNLTCQLFKIYEQKVKDEGLYDFVYKDEVMPLYKLFTIPAKRHGFPIDVPYFQQLQEEITVEIDRLEKEVMSDIAPEVLSYCQKTLDEEFPVKSTGNFPKILANICDIPLPIQRKTEKITLAKAAIEKQKEATPRHSAFYDWIMTGGTCPASKMQIKEAQERLFFDNHPEQKYIFNLNSNDDLAYYFFEIKKFKPLEETEGGKNKVDEDFFDSISSDDSSVNKLLEYKKLNKLKSTYIDGILDRQIDGKLYTDLLQHGTTSGRYSSRNPNLQNLPRTKEDSEALTPLILKYTNAIRKGLIAGKGYKIVDGDFNQLEVVCFAHMSGDPKLQATIRRGEDIYSKVAIDINEEYSYSADKKAANYLKKLYPELRTNFKPMVLGIVYGMGENRLMDTLKCDWKEAHRMINKYLNTYPNLKKYMEQCEIEAKTKGFVKTIFGRTRHLQEAKQLFQAYGDKLLDNKWAKMNHLSLERRKYKKYLNLAKNHKIQGLASSIVNRAAIQIAKKLKEQNIEGYIGLQIHDQICCIVKEDHAEKTAVIMKDCMENTTKLNMPLIADPQIADNLKESH